VPWLPVGVAGGRNGTVRRQPLAVFCILLRIRKFLDDNLLSGWEIRS
jgi:hypothetical protein